MKNVICIALILIIAVTAPIACTSKPVEKPVEKKDENPTSPGDKGDPKTPKAG